MARKKGKTVRVDRNLVAVPRGKLSRYRRRRMARSVGTGLLYVAGVGAVVALLANLDDLKNTKEAKDHWWLVPLGILVIGYILRKRGNPYSTAVLSAGGALFALAYAASSAQAKQAQPQQQQVPPLPAPKQLKKGETGSPFGGNTIPAMGQLPDGGMWVQAPDGQLIRVPRQQLGPVNQFVNRVMQLPEFQRAA